LVQKNTWIPAEVYTHESGRRNDTRTFIYNGFDPFQECPKYAPRVPFFASQ